MNFDEYQKEARKTAIYPNIGNNYIYPTLGLCGEAGEVAEKIKKVIRDNKGVVKQEKRVEIIKELGDIMWYMSNLCSELNISLNVVAEVNIVKLNSRMDRNKLKGEGDNR